MQFKEFLTKLEMNTPGYHNDYATAAYMGSDQTGSETGNDDRGLLPSTDLGIVSARPVSGKIFKVRYKENPVKISFLDANNKSYIIAVPRARYDELRPQPNIGRVIHVVFQGDTQQIDKITVTG